MNEKTASTAMVGRASGSITEKNVRIGPAPSTRAASSSSCGTVRKNCRTRNAPRAVNAHGMMSAWKVSTHPNPCIITYIGITRTSCGIISVARNSTNTVFRPRHRSRENA